MSPEKYLAISLTPPGSGARLIIARAPLPNLEYKVDTNLHYR